MPSTDIVDIGGVDIRSSAVLARDCAFPIVNWVRECPPDEVLAMMPIRLGAWENGTIAPAITDYTDEVTLVDPADDCDVPTLRTSIDECELIAPNMAEIGIKTPNMNWIELRAQFCRQRNILPKQLCIFNSDGSIATGQPYVIDFIRFALGRQKHYMAQQLTRSAFIGDDANVNEFDGLYNQLENGWQQGTPACGDDLNVAQVIDWAALTGVGPTASPDDVTIATTVTWWGEVYNVPAGLNLAQFLENLWLDAVEINWADAKGGVDMWEMHVPFGLKKCMLNTAACMQPCATCGTDSPVPAFADPGLRERFIRMMNGSMMELMPSGREIALLQTKYVDANTLWLGPSSIGGRPSYVLFLDQIERYFAALGDLANSGFGHPDSDDFFTPMTSEALQNNFESETLYWYVKQETIKCFEAAMLMVAGLLVCNRHLWLKIENVDCCHAIAPCDSHLEVDGAPVPVNM